MRDIETIRDDFFESMGYSTSRNAGDPESIFGDDFIKKSRVPVLCQEEEEGQIVITLYPDHTGRKPDNTGRRKKGFEIKPYPVVCFDNIKDAVIAGHKLGTGRCIRIEKISREDLDFLQKIGFVFSVEEAEQKFGYQRAINPLVPDNTPIRIEFEEGGVPHEPRGYRIFSTIGKVERVVEVLKSVKIRPGKYPEYPQYPGYYCGFSVFVAQGDNCDSVYLIVSKDEEVVFVKTSQAQKEGAMLFLEQELGLEVLAESPEEFFLGDQSETIEF